MFLSVPSRAAWRFHREILSSSMHSLSLCRILKRYWFASLYHGLEPWAVENFTICSVLLFLCLAMDATISFHYPITLAGVGCFDLKCLSWSRHELIWATSFALVTNVWSTPICGLPWNLEPLVAVKCASLPCSNVYAIDCLALVSQFALSTSFATIACCVQLVIRVETAFH